MAETEQPSMPIWAQSKAKKKVDVLREVAKALRETERVRANQPIAEMTEADLEAEQLRLEDLLHAETMTVGDFRRLREIDFYLQEMRERRDGWTREGWTPESLNE